MVDVNAGNVAQVTTQPEVKVTHIAPGPKSDVEKESDREEKQYKADLRGALSALNYAEGRGFDQATALRANKAIIKTLSSMKVPTNVPRIAGRHVCMLVLTDLSYLDDEKAKYQEYHILCENDICAEQVLYAFVKETWAKELAEIVKMPDDPDDAIDQFFDPNLTDWSYEVFDRYVVGQK